MPIFRSKKGWNISFITKKGEKILMFVGGFLGKISFLTGATLKLFQKSNSSPKNYLFQHYQENISYKNKKIMSFT